MNQEEREMKMIELLHKIEAKLDKLDEIVTLLHIGQTDSNLKTLLKELYRAYKNGNPELSCLTRSQLLFLCLEKIGLSSKIIEYTVEGNDKKNFEEKEKFYHISGHKLPSHVVVLLNGKILDANLDPDIYKPLDMENYKNIILSYEPKEKLIFVEEKSKIDLELCKLYAIEHNLETIIKILGYAR